MSKYKNDTDEYYESHYNTELAPLENDEFSFKLSDLRSKVELDKAYTSINSSILLIYLFEVILALFIPDQIMLWWKNFWGNPLPQYSESILFITLIISCLLFNKYGFINNLKHLLKVYGRAYYYKVCRINTQDYLGYIKSRNEN